MSNVVKSVLIVGSASIHTWRYLAGIAPFVDRLYLATNGEVPEQWRPANLVDVLPVDFRLTSWRTAFRLRGWIQHIQPQIVHVHQANSVAWHVRRATKGLPVKTLLTAWGSDVLLLPQRNRWMYSMVAGNLAAANVITSDSLYMASRIRELAGDGCRIKLLNYGIDALPTEPDTASKPKRVLSCRLHKPLYRVDAILRAWKQVESSAEFAEWQLTVAASGSETEKLTQLARQLGLTRVDFTGFVPGEVLQALYAQSRVYVSVPSSDATSISLLEAMGHGCLPVLSNLPANGEWVIDGLNGVIAEDIHHLADDLIRAMQLSVDNEQLAHIAAVNRQLVADKALHKANMAAFARLYHNVLESR